MTEDNPENDPFHSLIAEIVDAEARGEAVDREGVLRKHPQHEASLREFFANHDSMKAGGGQAEATFLPRQLTAEDATLPPKRAAGEDATLPQSGDHESKVGEMVRYFGGYELLEEIARGGMGVVYKARQVNLNRVVALKMILSGQLASEEDVKRFYTEAEAAANLDHPGIVPIFEIGQHQGQHYFSMGFIEGQSLAEKVANGPLPPREAAELVSKICEAMSYAHERGVIHRDLKPANILLDQNGQPKVTDFGLAKQMNVDSGLTGTGQILGTPSYMAPEQASGNSESVGPLADVYALGAILYCLLTGRPPFQAANPVDTMLQVMDRDPVSPRKLNPQVDQDLATIALKCLRKDGASRYLSSRELANDLDLWISGKPITAKPTSILEHFTKWAERHPASTILIALLIFPAALTYGIALYAITPRLSESNFVLWQIRLLVYFPLLSFMLGSVKGLLNRDFRKLSMRSLALGLVKSVVIAFSLFFFTLLYSSLPALSSKIFVEMLKELLLASELVTTAYFAISSLLFVSLACTGRQIIQRFSDSVLIGVAFGLIWVSLLFTNGSDWLVICLVLLGVAILGAVLASSLPWLARRKSLQIIQALKLVPITCLCACIFLVGAVFSGDWKRTRVNKDRIRKYSLPLLSPTMQLVMASPGDIGGWKLVYAIGDEDLLSGRQVARRLGGTPRRYASVEVRVRDDRLLEVIVSRAYPGGVAAAKERLRWRGGLNVYKLRTREEASRATNVRKFIVGEGLEFESPNGSEIELELFDQDSRISEEMVKEARIAKKSIFGIGLVEEQTMFVDFNPYSTLLLNEIESEKAIALVLDDVLVSDRYITGEFVGSFSISGNNQLEQEGIAAAINTGPLPTSLELLSEEPYAPKFSY